MILSIEVAAVTIPLQNKTGTGAIKIILPVQELSNVATYTITCTNGGGFDAAMDWQPEHDLRQMEKLGNLSSAPQTCNGCLVTFNEIGGLDRQSLPLVKEGECPNQKLKLGRLSKA